MASFEPDEIDFEDQYDKIDPIDDADLDASMAILNESIREQEELESRISSIDFGIYLHAIFHSVFTFTVQSPQNLRSNPYNRKSENGS